ncbi:MAG TPA: serine hydrolase domain-containing protein [Tepidisphaeraceae bacterium]|jgi:CubicO group peptidase (beta-lactamase class C family)
MPKWTLYLLRIALVIGPGAIAHGGDVHDIRAWVDQFICGQLQSHHVPGAAFALVDENGVTISRAYGYGDPLRQDRISPDQTLWAVGSLSKPVTALAVMQLVEQRRLDLHSDVSRYLGRVSLTKIERPITLHDLLTHSAGFDPVYRGIAARNAEEMLPLEQYLMTHMPPRLPPGQIINYSNYGYALAGHAVEVAANQAFADYVQQNIFAPAGMTRSSFHPRAATPGYQRVGETWQPVKQLYMQETPACGMTATIDDLARFVMLHLREGRGANSRIISPETAAIMQRRQFSHHPKLEGWTYGFAERYAGRLRCLEHGGVGSGVTCKMLLVPEKNVGFVVAYNVYDVTLLDEISLPLLKQIFGEAATAGEKPPVVKRPPDARLAGYYRSAWYSHGTVEKLRLLWKPLAEVRVRDGEVEWREGKKVMSLRAVEENVFEPKQGGPKVAFAADADRHINRMYVGNTAYERAAWWDHPQLHILTFILFAMTFGSAFLWFITRRVLGWRVPHARPLRWVGATSCAINALCLASLACVVVLTDQRELVLGVPLTLVAVLILAKTGAVAAAIHAAVAALQWSRGRQPVGAVLRHGALALVTAAFVPFMLYWNLL